MLERYHHVLLLYKSPFCFKITQKTYIFNVILMVREPHVDFILGFFPHLKQHEYYVVEHVEVKK